ncbi:ATP-dependent RNA helicase dbp4 [Batrachochytrium dendrobatidis]
MASLAMSADEPQSFRIRTAAKKKKNRKQKPIAPSKKDLKRQQSHAELAHLKEQTKCESLILGIQDLKFFAQLPLSKPTQQGLSKCNFVQFTEIQKASLPFALCSRDVLGAAKTGSGKTLAFILPVLEVLYRESWSQMDGVGAVIISPTRELALQIFDVLRKVGRYHSLSAGLLIGGKDLKSEQDRVARMNILVCTPGRLLQHMDQTPEFICDNLKLLVLDEADRILDNGFEKTINAIIANLPKSRQTLLFSATQTKSVRDLARLSLQNPEYVAVHDNAEQSTPKNLIQKYLVCTLDKKLDILFSFIKTHLKQKILVFLSSCKQVRFVFETFCKMQPGMPLLCLHGKQKQAKRVAIFEQYCRKQGACLFATDIAARGLDFPAVDWVVQVDCPEDAATYIHRVGRTARYESHGQALLLLLPSEKDAMLLSLEQKKVPITEIKVNPSKTISIQSQLSALCTQSPDIKYLGQKAFICYLRSIYLQANKSIFNVEQMPVDLFAESLGLPGAPKIKFIQKLAGKNVSRQIQKSMSMMDSDDDNEASSALQPKSKALEKEHPKDTDTADLLSPKVPKKVKTRVDKMFEKKNLTVLSEHYAKLKNQSESDTNDDEQDFLQIKRANHDIDDKDISSHASAQEITHRQRLKLKKKALAQLGLSKKVIFDEEGNPVNAFQMETLDEFEKSQDIASRQKGYIETSTAAMKEADEMDRIVHRAKLAERKRTQKQKEKNLRREESGPSFQVTLGSRDDDPSNDGFIDAFSGSDYHSDASYNDDTASLNSFQKYELSMEENDGASQDQTKTASKRHRDLQTDADYKVLEPVEKRTKRPKVLDSMNTQSLEDLALELLGH